MRNGFPKLVIFDMDGVLVDSERISNALLARLLSDIGFSTTTREAMDIYMGSTAASCGRLIEENLGFPMPHRFMEDFYVERMRELERHIAPVPGIEAVLHTLGERGVATCVASSNSRRIICDSLEWAGLLGHFSDAKSGTGRIFSASDDVERGKPHPDVFFHAADKMGVSRAECAVIEDSPRGAAGGVAAGMPTFGFARDVAAEKLVAVGAVPFRTMAELPALLASLAEPA
jgi:beta-phosphoglucomutase-like phosphatase (HAD superfamily)